MHQNIGTGTDQVYSTAPDSCIGRFTKPGLEAFYASAQVLIRSIQQLLIPALGVSHK